MFDMHLSVISFQRASRPAFYMQADSADWTYCWPSYRHPDVLSPPRRPITTWTYDKRVIAADINYELPGKIKRVYFQYMACAALKFFGFAPIIM